jgi:predicted Zn-dependent protease
VKGIWVQTGWFGRGRSYADRFQDLIPRGQYPIHKALQEYSLKDLERAESARIKREAARRDFIINANEFLPRLDNLIYGDNPREGFVEKVRFVHPDLHFQIDIPTGWKVENTKSAVTIGEPQGRAMVELTISPPEAGQSPGAVAHKIRSQQGTQFISGKDERINGNQAFVGFYRVQSDSGNIGVTAAFISHGGHIYQIAGLAPESSFSQYSSAMNSALRSFRELTDQKFLSVQPDRMKLYRARRGESLRSLAKSLDQTRVKLEDLVRINRIDPDQALSAGTWVKLIQPGKR